MAFSNKKSILQLANIVTPLLCFVLIGVISLFTSAGLETFESGGESSLIDPAGFAFAIWGPIFFFLFLFLLYQSKDLLKRSEDKESMLFINQISVFFILSTIMSTSWYIFWSFRVIWISTLCMILYLIFIIAAYMRLNINRIKRSRDEYISLVIPWSMYAGWVTAATIVSITTFFESINFNIPPFLFSDVGWTVIVLIVVIFIYSMVLITRNDFIYAAVGIWVFIGIIFERLTASILFLEIIIVCIIGIIILILLGILKLIKKDKSF